LREATRRETAPAARRRVRAVSLIAVAFGCVLAAAGSSSGARPSVFRVDHVADGDTITLRNGQRVRFVQIDTPEVYFGVECYGRQASARTKQLLHPGTRVYLFSEPATDRVDDFGRLLRYVVRVSDGLIVNLRLVAVGAAAPYFYRGRRGRYAARLEFLAARARKQKLGLWRACPHTVYDPYSGIQTRR
jgi:endonuclease YncB( thermonuclease family)